MWPSGTDLSTWSARSGGAGTGTVLEADERRIVGHGVFARPQISLLDQLALEDLGRLDLPELVALQCQVHLSLGIDLLDRRFDRDPQDGRAALPGSFDDACDGPFVHKRPHAVVDKDELCL